jgi:predicted metalloprotease with PDZ domain
MLIPTLLLAAFLGFAPSKEARLEYTLRFDPADTTSASVRVLVRNAPISIVVAAHAHPEYDDKYWRYVEDLRAHNAAGQALTISRIDSVRWQVDNRAGDVTLTYRVKFPEEQSPRASWRPFLSPTGGLIGGPHSFLYIVGLEKEAADITLDLPTGWKVGTGLDGKSTARHFNARDVHTLMESPMLVGNLSEGNFSVRNVPHRIFYWHLPEGKAFDSAAFVSGIEKVATQAIALFGSAPYREYSFLFQDGAWEGGLEHPNSVTLGARSEELAKDPLYTLREAAHEFFHTWNLMAIQPAEYREVDYRVQPPVAALWFSEGLTIFYADLLRRRARIPVEDSTRITHLEQLIDRYLSMPGNARFSAEQISKVAYNASPGALGDYTASAHLVGEILGAILDVRIRDATDGAKSMDDVMRLMFNRFASRNFTSRDVQRAADEVCACSTATIFDSYVFNAGGIDFNRYLEPLGLHADLAWKPATGSDGKPQPDVRVWGWAERDTMRLRVSDPNSVWAKAGLHTGDRIISVNGSAVRSWPELRTFFRNLAMGDSVAMVVQRGDNRSTHRLRLSGYDVAEVRLRPSERATGKQSRLLREWMDGR